MGALRSFFQNTRKPEGFSGRLMLSLMNVGHNANALWGLSKVKISPTAAILDIGCGGGKNIENLLPLAPRGKVTGVDYSTESVTKSKRVNRKKISEGRAEVRQAGVSELPFANDHFEMATAFETVYFWPDLVHDFLEVRRVLKPGGLFLICNEATRPEGVEKWINMLRMKVYTKEDLAQTLREAGFDEITCHEHPNGKWLCVTAIKPGSADSRPSEGVSNDFHH